MTASRATRRSVLLVCYAYPPIGSPGALRAAKFAKYLPRQGWQPIVLTPQLPCSRVQGGLEDHVDLPGVRVVRARELAAAGMHCAMGWTGRSQSWKARLLAAAGTLVVPDRTISWYPFAVRKARQVVRQQQVAAIYSTSPSITDHLIARRVSREFALPWVADFRDLWTLSPAYRSSRWRGRIDRAIEQAILRDAARLLVVSEGDRERLARAYPLWAEKILVLRNGFDPEDLPAARGRPPQDRFVLTYCGMFYGGRRSPRGLLRALATLKQKDRLCPADFTLRIIGRKEDDVAELVRNLGIGEFVEFVGPLPYPQALAGMAAASAGLVITMTDERSRGEMSTKFYECLGVRRPVLALSPKTFELAQLTEAIGAGTAIHPEDYGSIAAWLEEQLCRQKSSGPPPDLDETLVEPFSRLAGAERLAGCLNELVAGGPAALPAKAKDREHFHQR